MPRSSDNLALVQDEIEQESEDDAEAEAALLAAYASTRAREKSEVAAVEVPRYQNVPQRDANGRLIRGADGKIVLGPLVLYFHSLLPGTLTDKRNNHTRQVPRRERGRTVYDEKIADEELSLDIAYTAMLPWCRQRYYDNSKLWGDEAVGTGSEFMATRLKLGELAFCVEAVLKLEGLGDEREEQLGKRSTPAAP